jgi:hypothetical protein
MDNLHGLDDFRTQLAEAGWAITRNGLQGEHNACDWYAWRRDRIDGPDCECNDKPPGFVVWPYLFSGAFVDQHGVQNAGSVTVEICAEHGGQWLKLQVYSLSPALFFERWPLAARQLTAAWGAVAGAKHPQKAGVA